ncbi:Protein MKS-2 [Aphelenchoides avenae]|nr:Protein MKS-2 [Aphelenchus avenae]KAH7720261.1 Protein MKS-2 [Aphelenchus avenae]
MDYPVHVEICEVLIIVLFAPIEALRISWGRRGNLTETPTFLSFSLLLGLAVIAICVYLAAFQGYVLTIELVMACVQGGLVILESIFSAAAIASFSRWVTSVLLKH